MPDSIQVGRHHDIGQRIIVSSDKEGLILQVFPKLVSHSSFESQKLQLRGVVPGFTSLEAMTGIGYGVIPAIVLLLGEHHPNPSIVASVYNRKGFLKSANANTGAVRHFILSSWNAARVSSGSPSEWDLSLLFSPWSRSFKGLAILAYPFMKHLK